MKLMLRPEWRLRPLSSFLGFLDLKTGVVIALFFAVSRLECESFTRTDIRDDSRQLLNKVAGVYGLVAVLTGAGGSVAQLSLYIYSIVGFVALAWGLKSISQVSAVQPSTRPALTRRAVYAGGPEEDTVFRPYIFR